VSGVGQIAGSKQDLPLAVVPSPDKVLTLARSLAKGAPCCTAGWAGTTATPCTPNIVKFILSQTTGRRPLFLKRNNAWLATPLTTPALQYCLGCSHLERLDAPPLLVHERRQPPRHQQRRRGRLPGRQHEAQVVGAGVRGLGHVHHLLQPVPGGGRGRGGARAGVRMSDTALNGMWGSKDLSESGGCTCARSMQLTPTSAQPQLAR
jgi:hypothetical protein